MSDATGTEFAAEKLQQQLDLTLFERTSHGMSLTDEGLRLLPAAERALSVASEFSAAAASLAPRAKTTKASGLT